MPKKVISKSKGKVKNKTKANDNINSNTDVQQSKELFECLECSIEKDKIKFYKSYNPMSKTGLIHYCKDCIKKMISSQTGQVSIDRVKITLKLMDRPFLQDLWNSSLKSGVDPFGSYMKNLCLTQNRMLLWKDSIFESSSEVKELKYNEFYNPVEKFELTNSIIEKWGAGYKIEEYEGFERKYKMLKNHYLEKTAMHTEALLKYIRYSVKEELATSANDVEDAKKWGGLAKDAGSAAKINPSQLSASDLQDGLSNFGQLVRAVEQAEDIIPILPKFKESPQDLPDFVLLCYINYIRDLKGLPPAKYKDIWAFYEERKKEYKNRFDISNKNSMFDDDNDDINNDVEDIEDIKGDNDE
jgi:hypothetical protein